MQSGTYTERASDTMACLWGARPEADFSWHEWDGDIVVFVTASGAVHELNPVASLLLKTMLQTRNDIRPADHWFNVAFGETTGSAATDSSAVEAQALEDLLRELQHIGLLRQENA